MSLCGLIIPSFSLRASYDDSRAFVESSECNG